MKELFQALFHILCITEHGCLWGRSNNGCARKKSPPHSLGGACRSEQSLKESKETNKSKTLQKELEDVHRRATKFIGRLKDKSYSERLRILQLPSLEYSRLRGDMIDTYKYLTRIYDTSRPQLEPHSGRDTRGNSLKLAKHRPRLQIRNQKRILLPRAKELSLSGTACLKQ